MSDLHEDTQTGNSAKELENIYKVVKDADELIEEAYNEAFDEIHDGQEEIHPELPLIEVRFNTVYNDESNSIEILMEYGPEESLNQELVEKFEDEQLYQIDKGNFSYIDDSDDMDLVDHALKYALSDNGLDNYRVLLNGQEVNGKVVDEDENEYKRSSLAT